MKKLTEVYEAIANPKEPNGFCILKPGFTKFSQEFLNLLNTEGWKVLHQNCRKLTRDEAEKLYQNKKDEPYYQNLCDYMICDDALCCACHKNCKDPIGDMEALKKRVREQWGEDDMKNAMHSADSQENVIRECGICLNECYGSKKSDVKESKEDDQKNAQDMIDKFSANSNGEIDKLQPAGIISIIRNNEQFGYTMPVNCEDLGDYFVVKFDVNDFLTHNKVSTVIPNIAKFFKESEGSPKVDIDIKKYTLKIYKTTAKLESLDEAQAHELGIKEDPSEIINVLKCAFCEEMNAFYQYIIIAPFLQGPNMADIEDFYKEAAKDELEDHGYSILERLKVLGALDDVVDINIPSSWNDFAEHKYIVPTSDFDTVTSIQQNIDAEKGAIETYNKLEEISRDIDPVTNELAKHILADEQEHLQKLEDLLVEAQS